MELNRTEKIGVPTAKYPFDHVLFMEGNPEAMSRIDSQNAGTASPWAKLMAMFDSNEAPPTSAPSAAATTPATGGSTTPTGGPSTTPATSADPSSIGGI